MAGLPDLPSQMFRDKGPLLIAQDGTVFDPAGELGQVAFFRVRHALKGAERVGLNEEPDVVGQIHRDALSDTTPPPLE